MAKIRNGYVSNSSSSSFCFLGKNIFENKIRELFLKNKRIIAVKEHGGTSGEVADFIAEINDENIETILSYKGFEFFLINQILEEDNEDSPFEIKEEVVGEIYYFNRDYSSTDNVEKISKWMEIKNAN